MHSPKDIMSRQLLISTELMHRIVQDISINGLEEWLLYLKFARCILCVADVLGLEGIIILRRRRLALPKYSVTDPIDTHRMRVDDDGEEVLPAE